MSLEEAIANAQLQIAGSQVNNESIFPTGPDIAIQNATITNPNLSNFELAQANALRFNSDLQTLPELTPEHETWIERVSNGAGTFGSSFGKSLVRGFLDIGSLTVGSVDWVIPGEQKSLERMRANIQSQRDSIPMDEQGSAAWAGRIVGGAVPYIGAALIGSGLGIGIAGAIGLGESTAAIIGMMGAAGTGFTLSGQSAYDEAKASGATEGQANTERVLQGSIGAILSTIQIGRLLGFKNAGAGSLKALVGDIKNRAWKAAGGQLKKLTSQTVKTALIEGLTQAAQVGGDYAIENAVEGRLPKTKDGKIDWNYIVEDITENGVAGGAAGIILGSGLVAKRAAPEIAAPTQKDILKAVEDVRTSNFTPFEKAAMVKQLEEAQGVLMPGKKSTTILTDEEIKLSGIRTKLDDASAEIEKLRPLEKEEISQERGKRFAEFRNIMEDVTDPKARVAVASAALNGPLKMEIEPLGTKFSSDDVDTMYDTITKSPQLTEGDVLAANDGLNKLLFEGMIPAKHEMSILKKIGLISDTFSKNLLQKRGWFTKTKETAYDLLTLPWALLTSPDLSGPGLQGWKVLFDNPKLWGKTVAQSYRLMASEKYADFVSIRRKTNPYYQEWTKNGGVEVVRGQVGPRDDRFISRLSERVPFLRASGRSFSEGLNELRFNGYVSWREAVDTAGIKLTKSQTKDMVTIWNDLTGQGELPNAIKKLQGLTGIFFAPKSAAAMLRSPADLITKSGPGRKMLAGTYVKMASATVAAMVALDYFWGDEAKVGFDPFATDFGKVTVGNTQIDLTGGQGTLIRTIFQTAMGRRDDRVTGETSDVSRTKVLARFLQSKLSPHAGLVADLWSGKDYQGKVLSGDPEAIAAQVYNRTTPLFIQDLIEAGKWTGTKSIPWIAPIAWHGVRVQSYPTTSYQQETLIKDSYAKQFFNGSKWNDLGPEAQKALRRSIPIITQAEQKTRAERIDYSFIGNIIDDEKAIGRKIQQNLPFKIQQELKYLNIVIPGISKRVGTDWKLNDKRFDNYQKQYEDLINKSLTKLYNNKEFIKLPDDVKQVMLDNLFEKIKGSIHTNIVTQANFNDIQNLRQ